MKPRIIVTKKGNSLDHLDRVGRYVVDNSMTDPLAIRVLICNTGDLTYLISDVAEEMNFQAENGDYETYELWAGLYTEIAYLLDDETGAHDEL